MDDMVGLRNSWWYIVSDSESEKLGFLDKKRKAFEDLYRALRVRELAIAQLTVSDLDEKKRAICTCALEERRQQMLLLESDSSALYDLLESHVMAIKLGDQFAYQLHHQIRLYVEAVRKGHLAGKFRAHLDALCLTDLDFIPFTETDLIKFICRSNFRKPMEVPFYRGAFTFFKRLPGEIRRLVWKYALPGPRVLTHSALHNSRLSLLNVCRESREVVKLSYVRLLQPRSGFDLLENPASVLWQIQISIQL